MGGYVGNRSDVRFAYLRPLELANQKDGCCDGCCYEVRGKRDSERSPARDRNRMDRGIETEDGGRNRW